MNELIAINYLGDRFKIGNVNNFKLGFVRDCGLEVTEILDQKSKIELFTFFKNFNSNADKIIIHIKAHGCELGICQTHPDSPDSSVGDKTTLITWEELIQLFNELARRCTSILVNMGTVCYSANIKKCSIDLEFDALVTKWEISDPVFPRKLNKLLLSSIEQDQIPTGFELLRKNS